MLSNKNRTHLERMKWTKSHKNQTHYKKVIKQFKVGFNKFKKKKKNRLSLQPSSPQPSQSLGSLTAKGSITFEYQSGHWDSNELHIRGCQGVWRDYCMITSIVLSFYIKKNDTLQFLTVPSFTHCQCWDKHLGLCYLPLLWWKRETSLPTTAHEMSNWSHSCEENKYPQDIRALFISRLQPSSSSSQHN